MKSINATLLANQKTATGQAYATAALADNSRLHPTQIATAAFSGGNTIGCECGTFYMRLRYVAAVLTVQKITDPTVASQWTTWTAFQGFEAGTTYGIGIFWTGTYVVICYQDYTASGDIKYRRSTDGITFSAIAVAHAGAPGVSINIGGISAASPLCGICLSYASGLHFRSYNDATNTWGAVENQGLTLSDIVPQCSGFYDTLKARYIFAIETNTFVTWATYAIVLFTHVSPATWSAGQVVFGGNGLHYKGIVFAQRQVGGKWWMIFSKTRLWTTSFTSTMLISTSDDGLFWEDPLPTNILGTQISLSLLPAPSGGAWTAPHLANEAVALRLDTYAYWPTAPVMQYHFTTGHGGHQQLAILNPSSSGNIAPTKAKLVALLDNRDGALIAPRLFSIFTLTRGLIIGGVQYGVSAGTFYVISFRYTLNDQVLEIDATDAHGLLTSWFAHNVFTYRGQTVKQLVEAVCALAGVHVVAFDAFSAWSDPISAYSHPVKGNAHYSLHSLATRIPFEFIAKQDGSLYFYVPAAAPASVYTFGGGAGEHAIWPSSFGRRESATYVEIVGLPPRSQAGEALDTTELFDTGRKNALLINDRRVTTDAQTTALANAMLVSAQERKHGGMLWAPPSFALEPGDVVSLGAGSAFAASAGPWRVEQFEEHFNAPGQRPFFQKITLRGTA